MRKHTGLFLILLFPILSVAQKKEIPLSNEKLPQVFDQYIQSALRQWKTPGLSILVIKDGQLVYKKAYGVRDITTKEPYTTTTLSTCASTTKAMTAMCMGMLVDEGLVKWTDLVSDILPGFKLASTYATNEIKVKDLFTHNTGLGNADLLWLFGYSRKEILHRMQYIPTAYSLRSSFIYQNLMYMVAGEVIGKISGKPWDEFITERIFKPLGMNNTYSDYSEIPGDLPKTTPHFKDRENGDMIKPIGYVTEDNVGAAGGVWSCADDMSKWMQFLLDSARVNGKRLLQPATFAELFKPQSIVTESEFYPTAKLTKPHWTTYGLGWFQEDYRGKMVEFHTGSLDGLVAIAGMIPDDHIAVYVYANLDHSEIRHALMYKAFDLWDFHDNKNDWGADFYKMYSGFIDSAKKRDTAQLARRVLNTHPSLPLRNYSGIYTNDTYGKAEVIFSNDSLTVLFPDHNSLSLVHWNYDTFRGNYNYWWYGKSFISFSINNEGGVSGFSFDGTPYIKETPK